MLKNRKITALLVIVSVLFPLYHQDSARNLLNGKKSSFKTVLKIKSNSSNFNIKLSKKNTRIDDADVCYNIAIVQIFDICLKTAQPDSLQLKNTLSKYSFFSRATFS
jgi:hypothetical protein